MEIVEAGAISVTGFPVRAKWQELWVEMPETWQEFIARHAEIEHQVRGVFVDVSLDKIGNEYLQLVGTQVSQVAHIPAQMKAVEIPPQRYIRYRHVGPVSGIAESFGRMYEWARKHGHDVGEFKLDFGYTAEGGESEHDLYVGLLPLKAWREVGAA